MRGEPFVSNDRETGDGRRKPCHSERSEESVLSLTGRQGFLPSTALRAGAALGMTKAWRRAIIVSVVGLLVSGAVGAAFALWVRAAGDWSAGLPWERQLLLGLDRTVPTVFDWIMLALPWLGTNLTVLPILCVAALWLWRKHGRLDLAVQLIVVSLGSLVMNAVLKDIFSRARPELWPHRGQYKWAAYPSGHAIVGVCVFFTVAILLHRSRGWRWPYLAATAMLVISLYSRLYLGVHWPTDVIGGILMGALWLAFTQVAFSGFHREARLDSSGRLANPGAVRERSTIEGAGA